MRWIFCLLIVVSPVFATLDHRKRDTCRELASKLELRKPVKISPDCQVFIDGRKSSLEELRPGMHLEITVLDGYVVKILAKTTK
jgi:hypothetical protein